MDDSDTESTVSSMEASVKSEQSSTEKLMTETDSEGWEAVRALNQLFKSAKGKGKKHSVWVLITDN